MRYYIKGKAHLLPLKSFEVISPWDLFQNVPNILTFSNSLICQTLGLIPAFSPSGADSESVGFGLAVRPHGLSLTILGYCKKDTIKFVCIVHWGFPYALAYKDMVARNPKQITCIFHHFSFEWHYNSKYFCIFATDFIKDVPMSTQMNKTIAEYFKTQPVLKAWLFGSFARGEETPEERRRYSFRAWPFRQAFHAFYPRWHVDGLARTAWSWSRFSGGRLAPSLCCRKC